MSLAESPTKCDGRDQGQALEQWLNRFDETWANSTTPPLLEDFLRAPHLPSAGEQACYVEELIKIDLEYRWRRRQEFNAVPWTLADYAAQFQFNESFPSCELIGEEYWVRQLWGDRPGHAEYLSRYPQYRDSLRKRFVQLDAELAEQFGPRAKKVRPAGPSERPQVSLVDNESESISAGDTPINITVADTNPRGAKLGPAPCVAGYEILGVLDRGGMAVVYKARQLSLNRIVALKMIRGGEHAGPKELERFRAETQAVACLRHPHIVQVFEAGESNGMLYCAMELVAGGSLARKLNGVPVSSEPAARLTAKLARALDVAHQANIVHRDLKPANVLLEPAEHGDALELRSDGGRPQRYEPKVADFGLAKRQGDSTLHTATGELLGTPCYMAPEQAAGNHAAVGPSTDVYALGAMLYEMLTGRPPFRATSSLETLRQVVRDEPVSPRRLQSDVPRDLETICLKCLEKVPRRRYSSAAELADDCDRFLAHRPIVARRAGALERVRKWSRRNPAWAVAVAIGALAAVTIIAGSIRHSVRLQAEVERANVSAAEAQRQKTQVLANFNMTHETLLGMLTRLWQESQIADNADQRALRESLLQTMLGYYSEVPLEQDLSDPDVRLTKALIDFYAAHIRHYLEEYDQAAALFHSALPTLEELATAHPDNSGYRRWWALCCYRLALTDSASNKPEQATHWLRRALAILGETQQADLSLRCLEARCHMDLARHFAVPRELAEAKSHAGQAAALWRSAVREEPRNDEYRSSLSTALNFLARLLALDECLDQSEALIAECEAVVNSWDDPANSYHVLTSLTELADSHRVLGHATSAQGRHQMALDHFLAALQHLDQVSSQNSQYSQAQHVAHGVYWSRSATYDRMGLQQEALKDWDRCVEVSPEGIKAGARIARAKYRLTMGDYDRASTEAMELLGARELTGSTLFDLATLFCRCAEAAERNEPLSTAEPACSRDELVALAIESLVRCQAVDFFSDPNHRHDLETSPELSILRSHRDYQELLNQFAATPEP
jgi:serine/threonine protein kinase/tetratricopeptide (TPR) repeat protein